jgi:transcriptional regulator with XRE-family HTH domain
LDFIDVRLANSTDDVMPLIRQQLEAKGKTQVRMARHLGISTRHLNFLMTGKATPTLPMLFRMLRYLDMAMVLTPTQGGGSWTAQPRPDAADGDSAWPAS